MVKGLKLRWMSLPGKHGAGLMLAHRLRRLLKIKAKFSQRLVLLGRVNPLTAKLFNWNFHPLEVEIQIWPNEAQQISNIAD